VPVVGGVYLKASLFNLLGKKGGKRTKGKGATWAVPALGPDAILCSGSLTYEGQLVWVSHLASASSLSVAS